MGKHIQKKTSLAPWQLKYLRWASGHPMLPASCHSDQSFLFLNPSLPHCLNTTTLHVTLVGLVPTIVYFTFLPPSYLFHHNITLLQAHLTLWTRGEKVDFQSWLLKLTHLSKCTWDISLWMYISHSLHSGAVLKLTQLRQPKLTARSRPF